VDVFVGIRIPTQKNVAMAQYERKASVALPKHPKNVISKSKSII
jgi:hypothetical protein